jgi:hypothetical protein
VDRKPLPIAAILLWALFLVAVPSLYVGGYLWHYDESNSNFVTVRTFRYRWLVAMYWPAVRVEEWLRHCHSQGRGRAD